jgi:hypothetical protein
MGVETGVKPASAPLFLFPASADLINRHPMKVIYFQSAAALRKWFMTHHAKAVELWVGYYKKGMGILSITWPESVDEALCVGWIDGFGKVWMTAATPSALLRAKPSALGVP